MLPDPRPSYSYQTPFCRKRQLPELVSKPALIQAKPVTLQNAAVGPVGVVALRDQDTNTEEELLHGYIEQEKGQWIADLKQREEALWQRELNIGDHIALSDDEHARAKS